MKYKKCPQCELNYIKEDEELCVICKKKNNPKEAFDAFYKPICEWFKEKLFLI